MTLRIRRDTEGDIYLEEGCQREHVVPFLLFSGTSLGTYGHCLDAYGIILPHFGSRRNPKGTIILDYFISPRPFAAVE